MLGNRSVFRALSYASFLGGEIRRIGESLRGLGKGVEFVEFAAEDGRVGQVGFVVCDQSGRGGAGERVFDNLCVLCSTEENADRGTLVGFTDIAVEGFEVECEFAEVLGLEGFNF